MTPIRVRFKFNKEQIRGLVVTAIQLGYTRSDQKARWTQKERKKAARYAIEMMVDNILNPKPQFESVSNEQRGTEEPARTETKEEQGGGGGTGIPGMGASCLFGGFNQYP